MDTLFQELIINTGWAGVAAIVVWKVVAPLVQHFIGQRRENNTESFSELQGRVNKLSNNHIEHLQKDVSEIKQNQDKVWKKTNDIESRLTRVETIIERYNGKI